MRMGRCTPARASVRAAGAGAATAAPPVDIDVAATKAKVSLRALIQKPSVRRGLGATADERGQIEEAQIALEATSSGVEFDPVQLAGRWRLEYTSARDVFAILGLDNALPGLTIGAVAQRFVPDADDSTRGTVFNEASFGVAPLTLAEDGATFLVEARYTAAPPRRALTLQFDNATLGGIRISPGLETVLVPSLLPRTQPQMDFLSALKDGSLVPKIPLRTRPPLAPGANSRRTTSSVSSGSDRKSGSSDNESLAGGPGYLITYIDDDTLVGRQTDASGCFIFVRD